MPILETDRLIISRLTENDASFILELLNDPAFLKYIGDRNVRTLDDARDYILNGPMKSYKKHGFGLYLVKLKEGGVRAGICGLKKRKNLTDVDIGFAFLPEYRQKGFAYEAASAILNFARNELGLFRIVAIVQPDNTASKKLLKKLEMDYEKTVQLSEDEDPLQLYASNFTKEDL